MSDTFKSVAIVGLGLIGSSIARAIRQHLPDTQIMGYDRDAGVCARAQAIDLCDSYHTEFGMELVQAQMVILCVPVGAMAAVAGQMAPHLSPETIISDVGSCKASVLGALRGALPDAIIVPAHPVAGTENSGPESGFASLFKDRWCILTPDADASARAVWQCQQAPVADP